MCNSNVNGESFNTTQRIVVLSWSVEWGLSWYKERLNECHCHILTPTVITS